MIRLFRKLGRYFGRASTGPSGRCFVSHSYDDAEILPMLEAAAVGCNVELHVFPPIAVPPEQMVSEELLATIRGCKSLVYLATAASAASPWVTLERDYALRSGLDVYSFDPATNLLRQDVSEPLDLPVFASYSRRDWADIERLVRIMKDERFVDVFLDVHQISPGQNIAEAILQAITDRLERGGYMVLFWSAGAARSDFISREFQHVLLRYRDRILPVRLDGTALPTALADVFPVQLRQTPEDRIDHRRLDDLIVRLYWLIFRNTHTVAGMPDSGLQQTPPSRSLGGAAET